MKIFLVYLIYKLSFYRIDLFTLFLNSNIARFKPNKDPGDAILVQIFTSNYFMEYHSVNQIKSEIIVRGVLEQHLTHSINSMATN